MTELKLYNTLTRQKEVFEPEDKNNVRMYVCGPTVYDFAHIGNARPVIVFDVLFRLLRHMYGDDKVTYVRNITDVDDKINARALRDFPDLPLNKAIRNVTEKTANQFHADVKALGCLAPTHEPRATEHIDGMIAMIQTLFDKGHAYVAKGAQGREVLFRITSMEAYGKLSNRKLEDQQAGARIAVEGHKENPGDFVLWKESKADEPGWPGSFNAETIHGRPGWHIECSAMSAAYLGETFDIHGGGLDLIFPHHENEIAQSCCAYDADKMARYWMHNGYLQVEGKKMSKSDGNFVTIHDLLHTEKFGGRKWPGEVLRLAMLMTHYREPIDFSVRRLEEAENVLKQFRNFSSHEWGPAPDCVQKIYEAIDDDLNIHELLNLMINFCSNIGDLQSKRAVSIGLSLLGFSIENVVYERQFGEWLFDLVNETWPAYGFQTAGDAYHALKSSYFRHRKSLDYWIITNQNFDLSKSPEPGITADVLQETSIRNKLKLDSVIDERLSHLNAKNFAEADRIRDELASQGIQLRDSKDLETGERITTWEVKQ